MSQTTEMHLPVLGAEGEPCGSCGAALATDQRYCLNCGWRRGAARVDIESILDQDDPGEAVPATVAGVQADQRVWTPLAIVGSIAVLGLMMLAGVLIGNRDNGQVTTAAAPTSPLVLDSNGSAKGASAKDTAAKTPSGDQSKGGKGGKGKSETVKGDPAVTNQIDALDGLEGPAYAKEAAKLPDTVAIPGKPPKPDGGTPGGGTDPITIGP